MPNSHRPFARIPAGLPALLALLLAGGCAPPFPEDQPPPPAEEAAVAEEAPPPEPSPAPPPPAAPAPSGPGVTLTAPGLGESDEPAAKPAADPAARQAATDAWFYEKRDVGKLGRATASGTTLYTNEDLQKLGAPPAPGAGEDGDGTSAAAAPAADEEQAAREKASAAALAHLRSQAEEKLRSLEAELGRIDQWEASLRNPYLQRVELTDNERAEMAGRDTAERLRILAERKEKIREDIERQKSLIESYTPR